MAMPRFSDQTRGILAWLGVVFASAALAVLAIWALAMAMRGCESSASMNLPNRAESGNMPQNDGARAGGQLEPRVDSHT
jgi:hypothetical protein